MNLRNNKKGITMVSLAITISVLVILTGIGINLGVDGIKESKDNKLVSELNMVQHAILEQYTKYQTTKDISYLVGNKMTNEEVEQIASELSITLVNIPDNYTNKDYYKLDKAALLELGFTKSDDEYVVNYVSGEVINVTQKTTSKGNALYIRANSFYN